MERRRKYLKLLAFVPAIVLVGGFIGYRAGAFELFSKPEPQPEVQPESNATSQPAPSPAAEASATFMPGSKSALIGMKPPGEAASTSTPPPGAVPPNSQP